MEQNQDRALFWKGLLTGVGLAAAALALVAAIIVHRGVEVAVQTAEISAHMEREVEAAVRREVPAALAKVRADLPNQVASEAGRRLAETRIDLGGFAVPVPPAAIRQVEQAIAQSLQLGVDAAVRQVDVNALASRLGMRAASLADQRLREILLAQTISVEVAPGLKVPVRLVPR